MKEKSKRNPIKKSSRLFKKHNGKDLVMRYPNSDDPYELTETPINKMTVTDHPHQEEILD